MSQKDTGHKQTGQEEVSQKGTGCEQPAPEQPAPEQPAPEQPMHVHLRFAEGRPEAGAGVRWAAPPVALRYAATGAYELAGTIAGTASGTTSGMAAVMRYALSFGEACEVVGPERLRRAVAEEARRVAALYAGAPSSEPPAPSEPVAGGDAPLSRPSP